MCDSHEDRPVMDSLGAIAFFGGIIVLLTVGMLVVFSRGG